MKKIHESRESLIIELNKYNLALATIDGASEEEADEVCNFLKKEFKDFLVKTSYYNYHTRKAETGHYTFFIKRV